jgi:hypothetical protein
VPAVEADLAGRCVHALFHAADVAAGAEALAGTGQHQGLDGLVAATISSAWMNSLRIASLIALRLSGRFRVIVAIEDSTFRSMQRETHGVLRIGCSSRVISLMLFSLTIFLQRASSAFA